MAGTVLMADGGILLPVEIRKLWGLEAGDRVALRMRSDGIVEMQPEQDDLMALCGSIKPKVQGVTVEDMNRTIREAASGK